MLAVTKGFLLKLLTGAVVVLAGGLAVFVFVRVADETGDQPADIVNLLDSRFGGPQLPEADEAGHTDRAQELSLENFFRQEFNGSGFTVGQVIAKNDAYTRYFITYNSAGLKISGIMNVPDGAGPFPVLILNHGYIDPAVYTNGRGLKREQDYLARHGYVVIHPDYRNHAQSDKDPDSDKNLRLGYAEDVINLIMALKKAGLPYADSSRIGMLGHSMGGGVALNIAVSRPDLVKAFVLFAPVSADARDNFNKWLSRRPQVAQAIIAVYGAPDENPAFWDSVSPVSYFDRVAAPIVFHHGTADESVPLEWTEKSVAALQSAGKNTVLHIYPGQPHEFTSDWTTVMQRTVQFFDEHVAG